MAIQELEFAPEAVEGIDTWNQPRTPEQLSSFLGGKLAELALADVEVADDDDASLFNLTTV